MTTGEKIQKLRKDNNYTQEDLADILKVSRQSISKWESDIAFPETDNLLTLAKLFKCTIDYLLNVETDEITKVVAPNKGKKNYNFNKSKLPFVVPTLVAILVSLFLFVLPWAKFGPFVLEYTGFTYSIIGNYYEFAFFQIIINSFSLGNTLCLLCFLLVLSNLAIAIAYLFVDEKWMNAYVKIVNCVIPVLVLVSMLFFLGEWTAVIFVLEAVFIALVICQFRHPKIRKII